MDKKTANRPELGGKPTIESDLYTDLQRRGIVEQVASSVRKKIYQQFIDIYHPTEDLNILDVGVTCDIKSSYSNFLEQEYPFPHRITGVGVEDGVHLETIFPGFKYRRIEPHQALPFKNGEFDIVFSNAVIEHVGSRSNQKFFFDEIVRVGKKIFITTPNRWFPIEHHTGVPLAHFLPAKFFRKLLAILGHQYYAQEEHLNILSLKDFYQYIDLHHKTRSGYVSCFGFPSNLYFFN